MATFKIGVVDDEVIIADSLCATLQQLGYDTTEPAGNFQEAVEMIASEKPDLLIIDINLNAEKDGIELAQTVRSKFNLPFIFLTANADAGTIERAKAARPPAYLVKPFQKDELFAAIEICLHNYNQKAEDNYVLNDSIFIKDGNYFHKIRFNDILYLASDHVYVEVHTKEKKMLVRASLQQYSMNFDPNLFFRVHRSYIVNLQQIETINSEHIIIAGKAIPISKNYRDELFSRVRIG
jgi:two-component system, LytTR family, response regulator LytT